jgi:hypothetical protein
MGPSERMQNEEALNLSENIGKVSLVSMKTGVVVLTFF